MHGVKKMSVGVQDLLQKRNDPGYLNWLAVGDALLCLSDGLRKYAEKEMKTLHSLITTNVGGPGVKCLCKFSPGKKPNPHGRATTCIWAQELKKFHVFKRKVDIPWHQSDHGKWHDPADGYWEIAKLFMSDLGADRANVKDPNTTDVAALLTLFKFCNHFKVQNSSLKAVTERRNQCAHAPNRTLANSDKIAAFKDIKLLMNDPELVTCKDVKDCEAAIKRVEDGDISILLENELRLVQEFRLIQEVEQKLEAANEEIKSLRKENEERKRKLVIGVYKISAIILPLLLAMLSLWRAKLPGLLLTAFFMFSQVGDKTAMLSDDDCDSIAMMKSPLSHFEFQQFDYSSYLAYKREGFVGRKWFFLELENIFEKERGTAGVLITGQPGSGKSAMMSQLICSPFSSLLIHNNIIGYHLCESSERRKRDGARFVQNLVDQIAARVPGYSEFVTNNEQLRRELKNHCQQDPTECFFTSILGPLRKLKQPPGHGLRYIVIDALDECLESDKSSEIIEILSGKIPHFPKWLKVILTSRNLTTVTTRIPQMVRRTPLYAMDERNVNDIRYYVSRFVAQNSFFLDRLLADMNIKSRTYGIKLFLDKVVARAEGNFLFVKMTLQYMNDTDGEVDLQSLPTNLFDLYNIFFNRQFGKDGFGPFRSLFEVLLAVSSPPYLNDVREILKNEYKADDVDEHIEQASCFLRFGHDGTIGIYHQSFADWLMTQTAAIHINKTRGHQNIARFLLRRIKQRHVNVTFEELTELFMHILYGGTLEIHRKAIELFNITEMREPQTNQSILHNLATKPVMYLPVLDFFLPKFKNVDLLDASNKTPAFYAASEGLDESLQSFIDRGADVTSFLEGFTDLDPAWVVVRNTGIEEFSLMHAAASKGHKNVVERLIKNNVSSAASSKNYPTPLHLAAGNGHLEVVRIFYDYDVYNVKFDPIALHHAAARNHLDVVDFLLTTAGVRDRCLLCLCRPEQLKLSPTVEDVHLYFCETALHAAVSRGHVNIVKMLLASGIESLECNRHSGKTVLMDAVERNDVDMIDLLLENGANVTTECGKKRSKDSDTTLCSFSKHNQDFLYTVYCKGELSCECGDRAVHVSARHGLWNVAEKLIKNSVFDLVELRNCGKKDALNVAISHGHTHFIYHTNETLKRAGRKLVDRGLVELAVSRCSVNELKHMINYPVNGIYENRWDFLLDSVHWYPHLYDAIKPSVCLDGFQNENLSLEAWIRWVSEKRLAIIKLLIESYEGRVTILNKQDDFGRTLLHHAAENGFESAVKYFVEIGADELIKDVNGNSPLFAVSKSGLQYHALNRKSWNHCYTTNDGQFTSCNTTNYDEIIRYLIWSHASNFSKCDVTSADLLQKFVEYEMPLSLYALLTLGVDTKCTLDKFHPPFLKHLRTGGRQVSEVFKLFNVEDSLTCGKTFTSSELHLMSYLSTPDDFGNFFKPSQNKKKFPLQRLIDKNPDFLHTLEKCYDAEGYLPIHRAVQGGNLAALKWFQSVGVNTHLKTRNGLTALDLSILYLGDISNAELIAPSKSTPHSRRRSNWQVPLTTSKYRNQVFEELLRTFSSTRAEYNSGFPCGPTLEDLSPLHIAAVKGMVVLKYVHKKASEVFPSLPLNCVNKHRVDPVYVAYFYESLLNEGLIDTYSKEESDTKTSKNNEEKNSNEIKTGPPTDRGETGHDGEPIVVYPDREVDYYMAINYFYLPTCYNITNKELHENIPENIRISDCPGYHESIPNLEETTSALPVELDVTECSEIHVRQEYYWSLCMFELEQNHIRKYPCSIMVNRLRTWFASRRRRNRQISQFIAKRIGWNNVSQSIEIQNRWPFLFLHKMVLNKSFDYLKILNTALEVADVRFGSGQADSSLSLKIKLSFEKVSEVNQT